MRRMPQSLTNRFNSCSDWQLKQLATQQFECIEHDTKFNARFGVLVSKHHHTDASVPFRIEKLVAVTDGAIIIESLGKWIECILDPMFFFFIIVSERPNQLSLYGPMLSYKNIALLARSRIATRSPTPES